MTDTPAIYNDNDAHACAWLRELIADGLIEPGEVVERSILDIDADELPDRGPVHLFAGIGGWSYALRLAGVPDGSDVWTVSCPCQPFSSAGKRRGTDDERHLWPAVAGLVAERQPPIIFGEQVASADGRAWLAGVRADLEALGYRCAAADLCAAGVGAPHIRQRLFWVADAEHGRPGQRNQRPEAARIRRRRFADGGGVRDGLGDASEPGPQGHAGHGDDGDQPGWDGAASARSVAQASGEGRGLANASGGGRDGRPFVERRQAIARAAIAWAGEGVWLVRCVEPTADGGEREVWRRCPTEPGLFPLAHGIPGRVAALRGAGNAIVPQVAAEFIGAYIDAVTQEATC
jgi:DNA (cytosine-5)-methyltransferase 1